MSDASTVQVHRDIPFHRPSGRDEPLRLDVYEPIAGADRPSLVFYHGGAWREGDKAQNDGHARALAARGVVCVAPTYRLSGEATFPAQARDAAAAVRFLRANTGEYGVDPERIAAGGVSAGAHLAALVGAADGAFDPDDDVVSSTLAAVVGVSGIYDFRGSDADHEINRQFLGGGPDEVSERYARASPAAHVGPETPPTLLLHGAADETLPADNAREFAATLRAAGRPVELGIVPDGSHTFLDDPPWRERVPESIAEFLERRL